KKNYNKFLDSNASLIETDSEVLVEKIDDNDEDNTFITSEHWEQELNENGSFVPLEYEWNLSFSSEKERIFHSCQNEEIGNSASQKIIIVKLLLLKFELKKNYQIPLIIFIQIGVDMNFIC
ncbi:11203_t:CDS:2, partial [Funneliformis caledonium]